MNRINFRISLDDSKWQELEGGYRRILYDVSLPLAQLEIQDDLDLIWAELWEELYHQGDVGIASYAAIPHVARIVQRRKICTFDPFALAVAIELARARGDNPSLPEWLKEDYFQALNELIRYACNNFENAWDSPILKSVLALLAIQQGHKNLGELIFEVDDGYEKELLDKFFEL